MSAPAAVAFDLDGTLVDTEDAHGEAYHRAFADLGVHVDPSAFRSVAGRHQSEVIRLLAGASVDSIDPVALHRIKTAHYCTIAPTLVRPLPTLRLAQLLSSRVPTALVTSASRETAIASISSTIDFGVFDVIVTADDVERHKPHPEPYLLAAAQLGVATCDLIVFEDSKTGLQSARAAGCVAIHVSDRHNLTDV